MSVSVSRRIVTSLCRTRWKEFSRRPILIRSNCTDSNKTKPDTEPSKSCPNTALAADKISAAVLKNFGEPLVLDSIDSINNVKDSEVLIGVHYCALNASDALLSKNLYTFTPQLPAVLGYEVVGKILKVGEEAAKSGYQVGDKVVALNKDRYGGLAEQCIAEVQDVWKIPQAMKSLDAASLFDNYINALIALEKEVCIKENDIILVNVGVSGIGLAIVDLASNIFLGKVISVCTTEEGATLARGKGAYTSLKYKERHLLKHVQEVAVEINVQEILNDAGNEKLKKVLEPFTEIYKKGLEAKDLLRDDNFCAAVHQLSTKGRVLVFGNVIGTTDCTPEAEETGSTLVRIDPRKYRTNMTKTYRQAGSDIIDFFDEGLIRPTTLLTVGLHKVNDAIKFIFESKLPGKVVIDIRDKEADVKRIADVEE